MPNLQALRTYRRVVELHSFNAAARSLDMTASAVSKLVARLEADVGARLLNRTTRTVSTTEEGAEFYEAAVRVLDELELASERARSRSSTVTGTLKVSVPTSFALRWLSTRVPNFLTQYPKLKLDLALNDRFVDLVQEGFDCALRITTELADSNLIARRLGTVARVLVAAPSYLANCGAPAHPDDLRLHNCLVYSQHASGDEWPLGDGPHRHTIEVNGNYRANNSVMFRHALVAGQGIALTPLFIVDDLLATGVLIEVLKDYRAPPHSLYGVIAQRRFVARKVRAFFDYVEGEMAAAPRAAT
jgi:DNA-binding transcriptional LysR family regulator